MVYKRAHDLCGVVIPDKDPPRVPHGPARRLGRGNPAWGLDRGGGQPQPGEHASRRQLPGLWIPPVDAEAWFLARRGPGWLGRVAPHCPMAAKACGCSSEMTAVVAAGAGLSALVAVQNRRRMATCAAAAAGLAGIDHFAPDAAPAVVTAVVAAWLAVEYAVAGRPPNRPQPVHALAFGPGLAIALAVLGGLLKTGGRDPATVAIGQAIAASGRIGSAVGLFAVPWLGLWRATVGCCVGAVLLIAPPQVAAVVLVVAVVVPAVVARAGVVAGHTLAITIAVACGAAGTALPSPPLVPTAAVVMAAHLDAAIRGV